MPLFSVIIPAYNRAALIGRTLDSVLAQPGEPAEVIVVDDGSTDGTPAVVERYGARVTLLRQANRGPGAARNLALRAGDRRLRRLPRQRRPVAAVGGGDVRRR